jgi:hypothetical protein
MLLVSQPQLASVDVIQNLIQLSLEHQELFQLTMPDTA